MSKPTKLPSGRWRVRWVDADGKRQSDSFATYEQARAGLRRLEIGADADRVRREKYGLGALTVGQAGDLFLATRKRQSHDTERRFKERGRTHRRNYGHHIRPHLGDVALADLTPAVLRRWIVLLVEKPTARRNEKNVAGRTLSAATIRGVICTLRQICKANDIDLRIPSADQLKQKRRRSRPKALQCIEDVRALLGACRDPWFKVAAAIACYCGARLGEVASLRWRHVGEQIAIATSWEGPLKARYEDDEEAARVVPLAPELAAILASWRATTHGGDDDRIVLVHGKRPLIEGKDCLARKTQAACKRAGLMPLTFHDLRSSYATVASGQGLPVSSLQALMGHSDARTTAIYIRPESAHAALDPRATLGVRGHAPATERNPEQHVLN